MPGRPGQLQAALGFGAISSRSGNPNDLQQANWAPSFERVRNAAGLSIVKSGLNELIDDLDAFHTATANGLKEIDSSNYNIQNNAQRLVRMMDWRDAQAPKVTASLEAERHVERMAKAI